MGLLLDAGADPDCRCFLDDYDASCEISFDAIRFACRMGAAAPLARLLRDNPRPLEAPDLRCAVASGSADAVAVVIDAGAPIDVRGGLSGAGG